MSWRRALFLLPLVLFVALAAYLFHGLAPDRDPQLLPSALIDKPAPDFSLAMLGGGGSLASEDLKGQVVLINFFASWCVPCREEHPILIKLAQRDTIRLYGIAYKDKPENTAKFLKDLGDPFRGVGIDDTGRTAINFGVYGVPETYAIDRTGRIRWRHVGPLTDDIVRQEIVPLLKELDAS